MVLSGCGAHVSLSSEFVELLGALGFLQHPGIPESLLRISVMGRCKQSLSNQTLLWPLGPFFFSSFLFLVLCSGWSQLHPRGGFWYFIAFHCLNFQKHYRVKFPLHFLCWSFGPALQFHQGQNEP